MSPRLFLLTTVFLATDIAAFTATLRVPQDYPLIQRAALAAAPGDTLIIAEGTYVENVVVTKPLIIQGAGPGKTIFIGKDRANAVLALNGKGGAISAANLTVRHEPAVQLPVDPNTTEPPIEDMAEALSIFSGDLTLKNIAVESSSGVGVNVADGKAIVENVTVNYAQSGGLYLYKTLPGTTVTGFVIRENKGTYDISVQQSVAEFKKLQLTQKESAVIQVSGTDSSATFHDLSADLKTKIDWTDGASADGPAKKTESTEAPASTEGEENNVDHAEVMDAYSQQRQAMRDEHQLATEPVRRQLARDLQASIKDKKTAGDYAATLGVYFKALLETYQPAETADFGVDQAITGELRAFYERFGAQATTDAIPTWPKHADFNEGMIQASYDWSITRAMKAGIEKARGEAWVKANSTKLDEYFSAWKNEKSKDPAVLAAAFLKGINFTAELLNAGEFSPENLIGSLRERTLKELNAFIAQAGYPAVAQLLRQIAADQANGLFTAPELQAALTPEQKRELFKAMRGGSK
ncbi:hypothetical protein CMV30_18500 [Nibricoccus aquaticus]|uniref:DUF1565 domain-containing protein n=1 Tax=Nibricoccus aquaticus TaxID=2576891 RepID=A0A290QBZ7_9BACT|nr:hypothetical protein [Nibricoccus aquaticus]ATC65777.1 hypothetical protein CMV30_18500 [Nibricoccus aquaticus]